jgi:hypothetical protein
VSLPGRSRLAILAFTVLAPVAGLSALDLAIARATPFWSWVATSFPRRVDDSFLAEATVLATPPGRENVVLLGNSRADDGVDLAALDARFAGRGRRFRNLTVVGSGVVDQAMRAREVTRLEPGLAIAVIAASELGDGDWAPETFTYDVRAASHIFTLRDVWDDPELHLAGIAGELHLLARHRRSFQTAARVILGRETFFQIRLELTKLAQEARGHDGPKPALAWLKTREPDVYPNRQTRALEWLADSLRAAGTRLVVVEAPNHPILVAPGIAPRVARFREFASELAARHDFAFVPATRFPAFELSEFKDLFHLNEAGRARFTATLGDELESLL